MSRIKIIATVLLVFAASCTPSTKFIVSNIGYEPMEFQESIVYALPQTNLVVGISYEKEVFLPGPYCDYALKLLGINGVNRSHAETYKMMGVETRKSIEADQEHFYSLSVIEGAYSGEDILDLQEKGYVLTSDLYDEEKLVQYTGVINAADGIHYKDVTMETNIELKHETMYKTILTDTSFIRVPMVSEQLERKTLEKKAGEAAKLILEIRTDRYYLAGGMLDPYPQDFDLKSALATLDHLEEEYLSLFIGKSFKQKFYREFFFSPQGSLEIEEFTLGSFTSAGGFSEDLIDGALLKVEITPGGKTRSMKNLLPQHPEEEVYNILYYRIPEITDVNVVLGEQVIHRERMAIFQSGVLVNVKR